MLLHPIIVVISLTGQTFLAVMATQITHNRMVQAIQVFETKQQRSNISWLQDQVRTCERPNTTTKVLDERRNRLAKGLKYESWTSLASQHNLSSTRDLLSIDIGQSDKGTRPPISTKQQYAFLKELHRAINEDYDQNVPGFQPVDLPEDYVHLLSITEGLRDTDLRGCGVCGVDGIQGADPVKMTGNYDIEKLPCAGSHHGWEISTGFRLCSYDPSYRYWMTYYYCQREESPKIKAEDIKDHERKLKWRVFYQEPERFQHSFLRPMIFNDLVEWLEFYQKWWERESKDYPEWMARMKRNVELMYGRSKKDEEDPAERFCEESLTVKDLFMYSKKEMAPTAIYASPISTAIDIYRRKTTASHRALFAGRIHYLENNESLTDRQRLDQISPYFHSQRWGTTGHGSSLTSPSQLLILPGQEEYVELGVNDDGTLPPAAVERQKDFLRELQSLIAEIFPGLELPQEYIEFLTHADAISDPDFIYSRRAGMSGVCGGLPSRWDMADKLPQWPEWTVLGGWQCGIGDESATQLLFCQKPESQVQGERVLKWRLHHFDRANLDGTFFESIAQWLNWRAGWFERLPVGWETVNPPLLSEDIDYWMTDEEEEEDEKEEDEDEEDDRE